MPRQYGTMQGDDGHNEIENLYLEIRRLQRRVAQLESGNSITREPAESVQRIVEEGVTTISKAGDALLSGDVTLSAGLLTALTQIGQDIQIGWNSPLTTKGDLLTRDGTSHVRLGVGTNGHVLTADSAQPTGLKWAAVSGGGGFTGEGVARYTATAYTIANDENFIYLGIGASSSFNITLPSRSSATGPIFLLSGDDTYYNLVTASGDDIEFVDIMGGGSTTYTSLPVGESDGWVLVCCAPKKNVFDRWLAYSLSSRA